MADTLVGSRTDSRRNGDAGGARPLRRRRSLPGGRAVVGGFLVALAAVGVFAGYTTATTEESQAYLVARRDLPLGHRITKADLGTLDMDLPALSRAKVYRDPSQLIGAVVIGPVAKGELVQASTVVAAGGEPSNQAQISFSIESARALNGTLRRGEIVDVVATFGSGADGYSAFVVKGARVADRSEADGTLSNGGEEVITLAVPREADTLAVAHAVNSGTIALVRSPATVAEADESTLVPAPPGVYQPGATPTTAPLGG